MPVRNVRRIVAFATVVSVVALGMLAHSTRDATAAEPSVGFVDWVQPVPEVWGAEAAAVSADGSRTFVASGSSIEEYDMGTRMPLALLQVPTVDGQFNGRIEALAAASADVLYVLFDSGSGEALRREVLQLNLLSGVVAKRVELAAGSYLADNTKNFLLSEDEAQLYVLSHNGRFDVVDTATMTLIHSWVEPPIVVRGVAPDGGIWGTWKTADASGAAISHLGLFDPATGAITRTTPVALDGIIGVLPDQTHAVRWVNSAARQALVFSMVSLSDGSSVEMASIPVIASTVYGSASLSPDGARLLVDQVDYYVRTSAYEIDLGSGAVTGVAGVPGTETPIQLAGTTNGEFIGVASQNGSPTIYRVSSSASSPPPLFALAQPTVSGLQVGKTATASTGTWSSAPDSLSYQWYSDFAPIAGATASSLPITAQLYGHRIDVVVAATASGFASGVVTAGLGFPATGVLSTAVPTVSGGAALGHTLAADPGTWTTGTTFSYQWYADGVAIAQATARTFTVTSAQEGETITVNVTGKLQGYTPATTTSAASTVPIVAYRPMVAPAIAGSDRYATAVAISQESYPVAGSAKTVVITTGENFADALSAAPAAVKLGGPLLLTPHDRLLSSVATEVKRLDPQRIVVVGGTNAVGASVMSSLGRIARTVRVSGAERYATSLAVAKYAFGSSNVPSAFFATGTTFADALSAGAYAGAVGVPVLLVPGHAAGAPAQLIAWMKSAHTTDVQIVGGYSAISQPVAMDIEDAGGNGASIYQGANRFETNREVMFSNHPGFYQGADTAFLASGLNFPDALAGAAAAAKAGMPLFLVTTNCVPTATADLMRSLGIGAVQPVGGPSAIGRGVTRMTTCG